MSIDFFDLNIHEKKVDYSEIILEYLVEEGPKETKEIFEHLKDIGYNLNYFKLTRILESDFDFKRWKEMIEEYNIRKPYGVNLKTKIWISNGIPCEDKYLKFKSYAKKRAKN